jgi:hypothetical protein
VCTLWKNANTMQGSKEKLAQDIFKYLDYVEKMFSSSRFTGIEYLFQMHNPGSGSLTSLSLGSILAPR